MNRQTSKRISIINKIRNGLIDAHKRGIDVNYKRLIAIICLDENVSDRKAKEYVNLLINAGEFILENGFVYLNNDLKGGILNNDKESYETD